MVSDKINRKIQIDDIIGRTVTNMHSLLTMDVDGVDIYESFIELDNSFIIGFPSSFDNSVWLKELKQDATNLFADLSDFPDYYFDVVNFQRKRCSFFYGLRTLFGYDICKDPEVLKVEWRENKLKYVKDRKIIDYIWFPEDYENGYVMLDNGYLITEVTVAPHGTGAAGLHLLENISDLRDTEYFRFTDKNTSKSSTVAP